MMAWTGASALTIAQEADSAYNKEDYRSAIGLYERSLAEEGLSADTYYNLANAHYRNNAPGKAVANYERALRIDPTHADARTNLEFVRGRIQDRPEDDSSFLSNLHRGIMDKMDADSWAWVALGVFVLLLAAASLYIFSRRIPLRKTGFFGGIVLLFLFAYTLTLAYGSMARARSHDEAVVIAPTTHLSSTPRANRSQTDKVVAIHEGTKVEIVDSVATPDDPVSPRWYNVKINNSTKAWVRGTDVERI